MKSAAIPALALLMFAACTHTPTPPTPRSHPERPAAFWIDLHSAEAVRTSTLFDDLSTAEAIYVGETHTIARHHDVQLQLLQGLFARGVPLVLCLEQLEAGDQPAVDRYNRREIDFATLAREIDWKSKWGNYEDYRALCEFARQHRIPLRGLNAPAALIRSISRGGGVARLSPEQRAQLPADLSLDDPVYEQVINLQLAAHAAVDPAKLRPMFEAQMARDETMAAQIIAARRHGTGERRPTAFVVLGAGHMRYGLGTPAGVRRRHPGIIERLVLISDNGELVLTEKEKAASREIHISHAELRAIGRPIGDYLNVVPPRILALPPGHPPVR